MSKNNKFSLLYEEDDISLEDKIPSDLIIEEYLDYSQCKLILEKLNKTVNMSINKANDIMLEVIFNLENYKPSKYIIKDIQINIPRKNIYYNCSKDKLLFPSKFTKKEYNDIVYNIKKKNDCRFYIYNDSNNLAISIGYSKEHDKFYISCSFEYGESNGPIHLYVFLLDNNYDVTDELKKLLV